MRRLAAAFGVLVAGGCASTPLLPPSASALTAALRDGVAPGTYPLSPGNADVTFAADGGLIGTVTGDFTEFGGSLVINDPASGAADLMAELSVNSLDTRRDFVKSTLLGPAWFDAGNWPTAVFAGTLDGWDDDGTGTLFGTLTVRGVTREEAFEVRLTCDGLEACPSRQVGFEGDLAIDRTDYGMTSLEAVVGRTVRIRVAGTLTGSVAAPPGTAR